MPLVKRWKTEGLLHEADSDDSDNDSNMVEPLNEPWMVEFEQYMNTNDIIPSSMAVITW